MQQENNEIRLKRKSNSSNNQDNTVTEKAKSKTWLYALLGLLLLGGVSWYFMSNSSTNSKDIVENNPTEKQAVDPASNAPTNTQSDSLPPSSSQTTSTSSQSVANSTNSDNKPVPNTATDESNKSNNETGATKSDKPSSMELKKVSNGNQTNTKKGINKNSTSQESKNTDNQINTNKSTNKNSSSDISNDGTGNRIPASFGKASAKFLTIDKSMVRKIISYLQKNNGSTISIDGYASSEGELSVNEKLSQSRADAYKAYLISKGAAADKITATGKGIDNPIKSNESEDGRRKNRRVEVSFK